MSALRLFVNTATNIFIIEERERERERERKKERKREQGMYLFVKCQ